MQKIAYRVPVYRKGEFSHFCFALVEVLAKSFSGGNTQFIGDDYELKEAQLCTCRLDKSGNMSYCGDIVEHPAAGISVISWFDNGWSVRSLVSGLFYSLGEDWIFKIIGNTHANPEMLIRED